MTSTGGLVLLQKPLFEAVAGPVFCCWIEGNFPGSNLHFEFIF